MKKRGSGQNTLGLPPITPDFGSSFFGMLPCLSLPSPTLSSPSNRSTGSKWPFSRSCSFFLQVLLPSPFPFADLSFPGLKCSTFVPSDRVFLFSFDHNNRFGRLSRTGWAFLWWFGFIAAYALCCFLLYGWYFFFFFFFKSSLNPPNSLSLFLFLFFSFLFFSFKSTLYTG